MLIVSVGNGTFIGGHVLPHPSHINYVFHIFQIMVVVFQIMVVDALTMSWDNLVKCTFCLVAILP